MLCYVYVHPPLCQQYITLLIAMLISFFIKDRLCVCCVCWMLGRRGWKEDDFSRIHGGWSRRDSSSVTDQWFITLFSRNNTGIIVVQHHKCLLVVYQIQMQERVSKVCMARVKMLVELLIRQPTDFHMWADPSSVSNYMKIWTTLSENRLKIKLIKTRPLLYILVKYALKWMF